MSCLPSTPSRALFAPMIVAALPKFPSCDSESDESALHVVEQLSNWVVPPKYERVLGAPPAMSTTKTSAAKRSTFELHRFELSTTPWASPFASVEPTRSAAAADAAQPNTPSVSVLAARRLRARTMQTRKMINPAAPTATKSTCEIWEEEEEEEGVQKGVG